MKRIMERITKEANQVANQKKELSALNEEVMSKQREILEKLAIIKDLKVKNDESYKTILDDAKKIQKEHEIVYNRYQKEKRNIEKNISKSKSDIIKDLKYKQRLVRKYMGEDLKNIDFETLKKEEQRLKRYMNLNKISKEKFEKLPPEQQKKITEAKKYYKENEQRFNEIRKVVNYVRLVGNKNPEDVLNDIDSAIEEVNNNFNLENIDKLVSFSLDEKNPKESKDDKNQEEEKQEDEEKVISYEELQSKIKDVKSDILKYMKLMEKYKDDPEKRKEFLKAIKDLETQKKELFDVLGNVQPDIPQQGEGITPSKDPTKRKDPQRPMITFDRKTGNYTYINENGEIPYEGFFKPKYRKNGKIVKFYDCVHKNDKAEIIKFAMDKGLTKKQAKMLDYKICIILNEENPQLLDKYIEAFKGNGKSDMGFDIIYNLRKRNQKIERNIGRKNIKNIIKNAKRHKKLGIAQVFKDKSRKLMYGLFAGTAVATIGAGAVYKNYNLRDRENEKQATEDINKLENENKYNSNISKTDKLANKDTSRSNISKVDGLANENKEKFDVINTSKEAQKEKSIQNQDNELKPGDYVKINEDALLFRNPADWFGIKNGQGSNAKVSVKKSSLDKMYKINKTAYCSPTGEYVAIEIGQNLEDALKAKGLDKSFIEDENTIKFDHLVASGVAEWVIDDELEKINLKVDKFGNIVEKTEEQKIVDEAMENYYKQKSASKQQTKSKVSNNNTKNEQKTEQTKNDTKQQKTTKTEKSKSKNSGDVIIVEDSKGDTKGDVIIVDDSEGQDITIYDSEGKIVNVDDLEKEVTTSEIKDKTIDVDNLEKEVTTSEIKDETIDVDDLEI